MGILMGKHLALFWNSFLLLQSFWVENAKIHFFKKNSIWEYLLENCMCYKLVYSTWKTLKNCKFCL